MSAVNTCARLRQNKSIETHTATNWKVALDELYLWSPFYVSLKLNFNMILPTKTSPKRFYNGHQLEQRNDLNEL